MRMDSEERRRLRAAWRECATGPGEHLGEEELVRYHSGQLTADEQARAESHLAQCAECVDTLVDASEFLRSVSAGTVTTTADAVDREFEALRQRVDPRPAPLRAVPRAVFALAASLLVALTLTLVWALVLRQENSALEGRLLALRQRDETLQQESRRLQDQISAAQKRHESELAELRQPEVNVPIRNVYPRDDRQRSAGRGEANRIALPAGTNTFALILSDFDKGGRDYRVEILDQAGQPVWTRGGVRPDGTGDLTVMLDRAFLSGKSFTVKLYVRRGGRYRESAEYVVQID